MDPPSIEVYTTSNDPKIYIQDISFKNGSKTELRENQILVFVGPNNVGKSLVLKEICRYIEDHSAENKIIESLSIKKTGSWNDIVNFVFKNLKYSRGNTDHLQFQDGTLLFPDQIEHLWSHDSNGISNLAKLFTQYLTTENRLKVSIAPENISILDETPKHPIHFLQYDEDFEKKFSGYFKQAFGLDLIVNKGAGRLVPLHVGSAPIPEEGKSVVSMSYLNELNKLPTLDTQGDGMRGFVGVLLSAIVSVQSMLFIDEPEAFLHPPQAYLLGQMIANDLPSDKQIFLSTHSEDLLKGLIAKQSDRIKIIRIQRTGSYNSFNELNSGDIKKLWSDPLLRYSNILNGLFHSKVVVCESDGDCRFFGAVIDAVVEKTNQIRPDILFVQCGGKHRIPVVVNALTKLGVRVLVVADIDILNAQNPLEEIFEGLGGEWNLIKDKWQSLKKEIDNRKPELEADIVVFNIRKILKSTKGRIFPNDKVKEIKEILSKTSPWSEVKKAGKKFLPAGDATNTFNEIISFCKSLGLNILEVGELEGFDKTVAGHGPKWVNQVLEKDLKEDSELEEARRFAQQILDQ